VLRGRAFDASDNATSQPVMIVGERMAAAIWPGRDPIGQCVRYGVASAPCVTVVGVAEEMRLRSLTDPREFSFYIPAAQLTGDLGSVFVRVSGDAGQQAEVLRKRLQPLMPGDAYVTAVPMRQRVEPMLRGWRFGATMFVAFGSLALVLAALGLYSVIAYDVAQRRREIGVRMALGADRADVVRLVVGAGFTLTLGGVVVGLAVAAGAARFVAPLLFDLSPTDPAIMGGVALVLVAIGVLATAWPALVASRVDPNITLRAD
jgi:ABC-type antimicrobial peptide transport system permease subunit